MTANVLPAIVRACADECPELLRPMHIGGLEAGTAACLELMNDARQAAGLSGPSSVL
jgi:hypothetical protein